MNRASLAALVGITSALCFVGPGIAQVQTNKTWASDRYLVRMKVDRSPIREKKEQVLASRDQTTKVKRIKELHAAAVATQKPFLDILEAHGIEAVWSFWVDNCCIIKASEGQVERLRKEPMVLGIWKDEGIPLGPRSLIHRSSKNGRSAMNIPMQRSLPWTLDTDPANHRILDAQDLVSRNLGAGVTIGFFDTGVDTEYGYPGEGRSPHPTFNAPTPSSFPPDVGADGFTPPLGTLDPTSRLWDSIFVTSPALVSNPPPIDCNSQVIETWNIPGPGARSRQSPVDHSELNSMLAS